MLPRVESGTFRLGRLWGIDVYLHWLWFLLVVFEFQMRRGYQNRLWNLIEILSIFAIVLMHEFGHALACRSLGGKADRIVLWLLGGVAFVQPPARPGAVLWSIAAGPLVNVALIPVTLVARYLAVDVFHASSDVDHYTFALVVINAVLLVFNMLPIYPLDGGQILQALLWFVLGRARSLKIVSVMGLICGLIALALALVSLDGYFALMAIFVCWQSFNGYRVARALAAMESTSRPIPR